MASKQRLERIEDNLDEARHYIYGEMDSTTPAFEAVDRLFKAVEEMAAEMKDQAREAAKEANRLSCLENGIIPD